MRMPSLFGPRSPLLPLGARPRDADDMRWYWRWMMAWRVFTGQYDALAWPKNEESKR